MGGLFSWIAKLFWSTEMEIAILGLANAGKSSYVHVIQHGTFDDNMIPTVGFSMRKVNKGKVAIKVWDMGGQKQFRGMWERYCRDVQVIVFVVDSADEKQHETARDELWKLLEHPILDGIPLLVLFNKTDLKEAASPETLVKVFELERVKGREVAYYPISCKKVSNIDKTLTWLTDRAKGTKKK